MIYRLILLAGLGLLGACTHLTGPDLPICDGSNRRPANPYGSVLSPHTGSPAAAPSGTPATGGGCA